MAAYTSLGLVGTIGEDDHIELGPESSESDDEATAPVKKKKKVQKKDFNANFAFSEQADPFKGFEPVNLKFAKKFAPTSSISLDQKIASVRRNRKNEKTGDESDEENTDKKTGSDDEDEELEEDEESSGEEMVPDTIREKTKQKKRKKRKHEEVEEEGEKLQYSENVDTFDENLLFSDMNVSRPLMKALSQMNFEKPTPIQAATIPLGLLGRDICACAVTGSGKTIAFMLPILERLLYKPKNKNAVTRVLILVPTRELAIQVHAVAKELSTYCNIEITLSAGGLDIKSQEAALRRYPDVVIATPGRLIDHLHNSPSFTLENIEILVLDEADRMLDEYFAEQMKEVIRLCSRTRQTLLFSATMSEAVKDLASVSLSKPVRVFMNENTDVALGLRQEFIRVRGNREGDREAIVAALLCRTFRDHCITFIQTKKQAHRMHLILGLLGVRVAELHGNLSQAQRLDALKRFKNQEIDILLATDLAARGLDIQGVKTIINFTMPNTVKHYVHRVGRTARAGKKGRSVSLVGESERRMLKEIVKKARTPLKTRIIPAEVVTKYRKKIQGMEADISEIEKQEADERLLQQAENQVSKADRLLSISKQEPGADKRSWFQTHKERVQEKDSLRLGDYDKASKKKKKMKKEDMPNARGTAEDRSNFEIEKAQMYAAKISKKAYKPSKLRVFEDEEKPNNGRMRKGKQQQKRKSAFDEELTSTGSKAVKQYRAGPSYKQRKEAGLPGRKNTNRGKRINKKR